VKPDGALKVWPAIAADLVDIGRLGLLDGLLPHVDADVRGFHRVVGHDLVGFGSLLAFAQAVLLDEGFVLGFFTDMK
jgi:hypothetical protein